MGIPKLTVKQTEIIDEMVTDCANMIGQEDYEIAWHNVGNSFGYDYHEVKLVFDNGRRLTVKLEINENQEV
jgi:hypothetical protein